MASAEGRQRKSRAQHAHARQLGRVGRESGNETNLVAVHDDFALRQRADELGQVYSRRFLPARSGAAPLRGGRAPEIALPAPRAFRFKASSLCRRARGGQGIIVTCLPAEGERFGFKAPSLRRARGGQGGGAGTGFL